MTMKELGKLTNSINNDEIGKNDSQSVKKVTTAII